MILSIEITFILWYTEIRGRNSQNKNEKEKKHGKKNQDDVIITESTDGDGTVLMNSATIGYSLENNRIFIKNNDGASFESDHTKMLKNDVSTSEFISLLINESYLYYNDTALYNAYRITRGYSET